VTSARGGRGWRDTALLARGPVATDVAGAFEVMWREADGGAPEPEPAATVPPAALVAADRPGERRMARLYAWERRPRWHRAAESVSALLAPVP
jgi:hypothetical protein